MNFHSIKEEQLLKQLKTSEAGLNEHEALLRLQKYGKNEIRKTRKLNALKIFLSQLTSFLIIVLLIAVIISFLLKHWLDASVIFVVIILNSFFGFFQEYRAEKTIDNLKQFLVPKAKVLRENKIMEIDSREIVPGDILILEEGDKIMADSRIISSEILGVNEAALTGESVPVDKKAGILKIEVILAERTNMLFQGTEIVRGRCRAVVIATSMNTELGKVATMVEKAEDIKTPLRKKLDVFARNLGLIILGIIAIVSSIGFALGFDKLQIFLTAVSLAVSAIPEGLPAVITITLALATQRMSKINTLIRKLPAAETLGRATFICVDKTGTITEEKMEVKRIYVNKEIISEFKKNKETGLLFKIGILCNNARIEEIKDGKGKIEEYIIGDPTEKALLLVADKYGLEKKDRTERHPRVKEFPFSSERKMMSIVRENRAGKRYVSYVKGAPEILIKKCHAELVKGEIKKINEKRKLELLEEYKKMAASGLRVLAFSYKTITRSAKYIRQEDAESNLIFVGFQGLIDSPRKEVKQAIKDCESAGIKVIMITGDSALTAAEVGREIGLKGKIMTSSHLEKMSDEELKQEIYKIAIFARVSPEDKLRIVEILKGNGEIVAVTGDGINDAPALKKADIGIAVGRGTDIAKDSSDMILVDNNFASIVKAIKEGRRVYDNLRKFIKYMLSANFYEIILISVAIFLGLYTKNFPLPLLPLQILWLNLITDSFPSIALSTEHAEEDVMKRAPLRKGLLKGIKLFPIIAGIIAFLISLLLFTSYIQNLDKARTMAATAGFMFEMVLVFNCKTDGFVFKSKFNKYIIYAILTSLILHLTVMYTPLNIFLKFTPLLMIDWLKIIGLCFIGFFLMEIFKIKIKKI